MQITNFGARVISLFAPDRNGRRDDIIVGYDELERYVHNTGERFLGATVGRVANRICKGRMTVDGKTYTLPINNDPNCLHGGLKGIDMVVWDVVEHTDTLLTLHYLAPDGQDGFPGNLDITLTFALTGEGALDLQYKATTDKTTPVNLSQHAFFNLKGTQGGTILDHNMTIYADAITPVDATLIPTGEFMDVEGTPFDFRTAHKIGERVLADHEQLRFGNGYDHNWVLNNSDGTLRKVCEFSEDSTGRLVEIYTDQPGLQFYCGNFFDGSYCGKTEGQPIGFREALALETQKFPDSVNQPAFPSTLLTPGEVYTQHTVYRFTTK
ncbi:MAG: galactose mutarotase [Bacteroidales bacterium]|nr:galactose mutarotase [Bacteroidales bacterium]